VLAQDDEENTVVLPRQMGAINDYAAVLGGGRTELETQLQTIQQNFDVQLIILATIYDPFDNAQMYAQRVWDFWKLGKRTALLVFAKEQLNNQWVFEPRLSEDIRTLFRPEHLERLDRGLRHHLERQRIKTAMEESVKALQAMLDGSYGQPPPSLPAFQLSWVFITVGGLMGLGIVVLSLRAFLRNRCPRCGARLHSYRTTGNRRGVRTEYRSCPHCGYSKMH
jgi:predicted RNA-binding Zn-ribbon protein involved in translation (DUF1610 family)